MLLQIDFLYVKFIYFVEAEAALSIGPERIGEISSYILPSENRPLGISLNASSESNSQELDRNDEGIFVTNSGTLKFSLIKDNFVESFFLPNKRSSSFQDLNSVTKSIQYAIGYIRASKEFKCKVLKYYRTKNGS